MRKLNSTGKKSAFTLVEILVVIAILAILAVVTFVIINPLDRINSANDATAREEANSILDAVTLYTVDNTGTLPTVGGSSTALPTVTAATIISAGADATTLNGISPDYLTSIPAGYSVGQQAGGAVMVGITLSDSTVFTVSE